MTTPTVPPYEEDPLITPRSAYPAVQFRGTSPLPPETVPYTLKVPPKYYPEKAVWGVGSSAMFFGKLVMVVEAWSDLSIGDYYAVCNTDPDSPAASAIVQAVSERYYLLIDEEKVPEGEVEIFSQVLRAASLNESRSPTQWVLFKQTLPGGYDLRVWEPWHSELKLSLEGLPEGSIINADVVAAGVWCLIEKYQHIRQNDTITLSWAGIDFEHIVSPLEATGAGPLRIEVPASVLAKGNKRGTVYVVFKVVDVVGNTSGGKYEFSKPYSVRVELDPALYEPPIFFVGLDEAIQVDLDTQSKSVFTLKPTLPRYPTKPNPLHTVTVYITIIQEGQPDEVMPQLSVADKNVRGEPITVPSDYVKKAAGGRFLAWVEVKNASGKVLGTSGSTVVTVVGTPTKMPAPQVVPIEGELIPLDTDIAVTIPEYQPHNSSWLESLIIQQGEAGGSGSLYIQSRQAGPQGGVRDISKDELKPFNNNGPLSIFYRTNNGRGLESSLRDSDVLSAEIGSRAGVLPAPLIKFAKGDNVDPADVKRNILLMSFPYAGAPVGSTVFWSAVGADSESSQSGYMLIDASTAGLALLNVEVELKPEVLLRNIGGTLTFSYSVRLAAGDYLRSNLLNLSVGPRVVLNVPKVLEADKVYQDQLHPKDVINGATVRVGFAMRADDQIIVRWAGEFGISITEVTVRGNPATNSVDVRIPPEIIALAIREKGNTIKVDYRFTRGQVTYRSEPLSILLLLITALPAPKLNKIDGMILPLLALGDEAKIEVEPWILIQKDQRKFLTLKGTFADGKPYIETLYVADKVTAEEVVHGVSVLADVNSLKKLKEGSILSLEFGVSYAQRDEPDTQVPFGRRDYRIQAVAATLAAPAFDNKPGAVLTIAALTYQSGAFVAVKYTGMTTAQVINVEWIFPDGSLAVIATQNGLGSGRVDFPVSAQIIAASVGKVVTLRYKVTTGTKTILSDAQALTVETIPVTGLPQALINRVPHGGTLDLATITGNPTLALPAWPLSFAKQRVTITLRSNSTLPLEILSAYSISEVEAKSGLANIAVPRRWLEGAGASIEVDVVVAFDGGTNVTLFPSTTYSVKQQIGVIANVAVGQQPHDVVITSDGSLAYVTNLFSHSISVIDINARQVIGTIAGVNSPFQAVLSSDNARLYVGSFYAETVTVIDTGTRSIVLTIPVVDGDAIQGLALNGDDSRLFVACTTNSFISVHDAKTGASLNRISVPAGPIGMALNPEKTQVFIGTYKELVIVNANGLSSVVGRVPGFTTPQEVAFNTFSRSSSRAYLTNNSTVAIVDTKNNTLVKTLGGFRYSWGIAMNPRAPECYVGSGGPSGEGAYRDSLFVIDTATEQVIRRHTGFDNVAGIAFTPDGTLALIVNNATGVVSFFKT